MDIQTVITDFKTVVGRLYGNRLDQIILYGSYARGDNNENSDVDFLVVLKDDEIAQLKEIDRVTSAIYDCILKYNLDISPFPTTKNKFQFSPSGFYQQVRKEGIKV